MDDLVDIEVGDKYPSSSLLYIWQSKNSCICINNHVMAAINEGGIGAQGIMMVYTVAYFFRRRGERRGEMSRINRFGTAVQYIK